MHVRVIAVAALLLVSLAGARPALADSGNAPEYVMCPTGPGSNMPCGRPVGSRVSLVRAGDTTPLRALQITLYFGPIDPMTATDTTDSHFKKVRGLSNRDCVSFESIKRPGRFLRHHGPDTRVELADGLFDPWFREDATFCPRVGRGGDPQVLEYESVNHDGYFLRKTGDHLILSRWDSSQLYEIGLVEKPPVSLGMPVPFLWTTRELDGFAGIELSGACTGLTPFWSAPTRKSVYARLTTGRVVTSTATSTPAMGFYPRITLRGTAEETGQVYSIERSVLPCVW